MASCDVLIIISNFVSLISNLFGLKKHNKIPECFQLFNFGYLCAFT